MIETQTQHLEKRITEALVTIRTDHPHVLPLQPGAVRFGTIGRASLIKHPDLDERGDDIDVLTRRVDTSHHVTVMVNGWVRMVAEDFDVTATLPDGADVPAMCTFLERWAQKCSWHPAAEDMASELEGLVDDIRQWVPPIVEEGHQSEPVRRLIGRCTEQIEDEREVIGTCAGRVFAHPDGDGTGTDDHDSDDPWATCERCGSRAVVSVWQRWMFPEVAEQVEGDAAAKMRDRVLTGDEVLNLAHREFGKPAKRAALWHWVSRGQLAPIDRDKKPHTFRLGDVVDFLAAKAG